MAKQLKEAAGRSGKKVVTSNSTRQTRSQTKNTCTGARSRSASDDNEDRCTLFKGIYPWILTWWYRLMMIYRFILVTQLYHLISIPTYKNYNIALGSTLCSALGVGAANNFGVHTKYNVLDQAVYVPQFLPLMTPVGVLNQFPSASWIVYFRRAC